MSLLLSLDLVLLGFLLFLPFAVQSSLFFTGFRLGPGDGRLADLGAVLTANVVVRITPSDAALGTPGQSAAITVDNVPPNMPPTVAAVAPAGAPPYGADITM